MPENRLPSRYGVDQTDYPQGFLGQLVHPFRRLKHVSIIPQVSLPGLTGQSSIHGRYVLDRQSKSDVSDFDHLIGAEVGQARLPVKPGDDSK
jgi:hypothetical protein